MWIFGDCLSNTIQGFYTNFVSAVYDELTLFFYLFDYLKQIGKFVAQFLICFCMGIHIVFLLLNYSTFEYIKDFFISTCLDTCKKSTQYKNFQKVPTN